MYMYIIYVLRLNVLNATFDAMKRVITRGLAHSAMVSMSIVNYLGLLLYFVVLAVSMIASYRNTRSAARRASSLLLIAITWFYILRFTVNYPSTDYYKEGLNLFDVAYADVIWGGAQGNWGYTQMLLCWAIVGTVWSFDAPLYYQLFGLFGAMSGSYCLIELSDRKASSSKASHVPTSMLLGSLVAFFCVWMLPKSRSYRELSWWLWALHACLILPKCLHLGPKVHRGLLYPILAALSLITHLLASPSPWPSSDCQISISVDVLASSVFTIYISSEHSLGRVCAALLCYLASPGFALAAVLSLQHDFHSMAITVFQRAIAKWLQGQGWMNLGYWKEAKVYSEACRALAEVLGQHATLSSSDEVLCVGCGSGEELRFFQKRFGLKRVAGLDCTHSDSECEVRVGRAEDMASGLNHVRCKEFSKILALDCAYHFERLSFLRECSKVTECLCLTDVVVRAAPCAAPCWLRLLLCAMNMRWSNQWTEQEYREALEEAGFSKVSFESLEPHVLQEGLFQRLFQRLFQMASHLDYVVIRAEKTLSPRPCAAVVGSGMSGLIAAHLLEETHDVTIFEAGPKCGLVGLQEDINGVAVDVPLRFMMPHYYENLLRVIQELRIPLKAVPYNAAYQSGNDMLLVTSMAWLGHILQHLKYVPYLAKLMFTVFFRREHKNESFLEYMQRHNLDDHEAYRIYSLHLSWMLSCSYDQANSTPAAVVLGFIRASNPFVRMYQSSGNILRVYPTMRALQDRLLKGKVIKVNSPVVPFNGSREIHGILYDAVVVATDAPAAGYLLGGDWGKMLSTIHYQKGQIIVHKDPSFMPPRKEDWRTFNVREDGPRGTCQITVWLNKFWGRDDLEDLFETWNPVTECSEHLKIKDVELARATYTTSMRKVWSWIEERQGEDGFFLAGAYTLEGMSLFLGSTRFCVMSQALLHDSRLDSTIAESFFAKWLCSPAVGTR